MFEPTILVVDDDAVFRERLAKALRARGYVVSTAASVDEAMVLARQESPELAVVDLRMPGRGGLELTKELKALDENTQVVVLTGYSSGSTAVEVLRAGATQCVQKPADADEVVAAFNQKRGDPAGTPGWDAVDRALAESAGEISVAAARLHVHRRALERRLHVRRQSP